MAGRVLSPEQVRIHPGTASKADAIGEAAGILYDAGAVTAAYSEAMLQREQTVSTYMGNELAVPHGTNQTQSAILHSAVSVVRYDGGVDWDGESVTFVVGLAGRGQAHLGILSRIALVFGDDLTDLKAAGTPEDLYALLTSINE